MTSIAVRKSSAVARPLKVLVPLIKQELTAGDSAGLAHYQHAGEMLLEAKEQVSHGAWSGWLTKNFELSKHTARRYMRLAEMMADQNDRRRSFSTLSEAVDGPREHHQSTWYEPIRKIVTEHVNVDVLAQERQTRDDEVRMHRDLALQLVDIGFKALATRLHPDKGGSKDAMARLNRVRDELKDVAATRRFV